MHTTTSPTEVRGWFVRTQRLVTVVLIACGAGLGHGQTAPADTHAVLHAEGKLLAITASRADVQVPSKDGKGAEKLTFAIDKRTACGPVLRGQVVLVTYTRNGSKLEAQSVTGAGGTAVPGTASFYGVAKVQHLATPGPKEFSPILVSPAPEIAQHAAIPTALPGPPGPPRVIVVSNGAGKDGAGVPEGTGIYLIAAVEAGNQYLVPISHAHTEAPRYGSALQFMASIGPRRPITILTGNRAAVRSKSRKPVFYVRFPLSAVTDENDPTAGPAQLSLVRLKERPHSREIVLDNGRQAMIGAGDHADVKALTMRVDAIRDSVYMLTPETALEPGEYAFTLTQPKSGEGQAEAIDVFDFAVDPSQ